mmetsp:Transcript_54637/g.130380  ORF Transcript_54637/g.130380 Transcript_54637/m.130380 type:complete len:391 (-) Transcript_54637:173-1345(-)|eukprot:CAMPEP_0178402988 /NCGR_PEP_ID=MMETSP0689_2-20121128/17136_1 /TAXON_ID=160604 /ORGANISM="Amphidinium massartii, Strain CS-259" /LENGTH=390 /DNA_ID=CAMNT_0020023927 /DNA_START=72 /DNA_END=1244 /DNA_ORIENTATION=-
MSGRGAWELASGAKETGLSALFKGASVLNRKGEPVSVITHLKDKVVLLYFASTKINYKIVNKLLKDFCDFATEGSGEAPVVIFVSNDRSKEDQMKLFQEGGMHESWLCVEYSSDLEDIANSFDIKMIPAIIVVDRNGKAVVSDAMDQLQNDVFKAREMEAVKKAAVEKWLEWRKLAGDWRVSSGYTLSSGSQSAASGAAAPAANDRDAMAAMREARLKRLGGGGGPSTSSGAGAASSSSSAAPAAAAAAAAAPPMAAAAAASASASRTPLASSWDFPRLATLGDASRQAQSSGSGASPGYVGGTYTLAGGRVEDPGPMAAANAAPPGQDYMSDLASDGDMTPRDDADLVPPSMEENIAVLVSMGFDQDAAKNALEAAEGDIDVAVGMMVG